MCGVRSLWKSWSCVQNVRSVLHWGFLQPLWVLYETRNSHEANFRLADKINFKGWNLSRIFMWRAWMSNKNSCLFFYFILWGGYYTPTPYSLQHTYRYMNTLPGDLKPGGTGSFGTIYHTRQNLRICRTVFFNYRILNTTHEEIIITMVILLSLQCVLCQISSHRIVRRPKRNDITLWGVWFLY